MEELRESWEIKIYRVTYRSRDGFELQAEYRCEERKEHLWGCWVDTQSLTDWASFESACWLHKFHSNCTDDLTTVERHWMPFIELGLLWIKEFALYQPRLLLRELQSKHLLQEDRFETLNILWEITVVTVRGNVPRLKHCGLISHFIHFWPLVESLQNCRLMTGWQTVYKTMAVSKITPQFGHWTLNYNNL